MKFTRSRIVAGLAVVAAVAAIAWAFAPRPIEVEVANVTPGPLRERHRGGRQDAAARPLRVSPRR